MSEAKPEKKQDPGVPAWVMTFADLMTLLMCFFVLLLSFSEMDVKRYKLVAGSMRDAFGVQTDIPDAESIPKGTSIITQEFSPAKPEPTPINEIRQKTIDTNKQTLEFTDDMINQQEIQELSPVEEQTLADAEKIMDSLDKEIKAGLVTIETYQNKIKIRISEKASFPSGYAVLRKRFLPVLAKLRQSLFEVKGKVIVAGHTDNVPIKNKVFRSNWDLSSARAVSVVHELLLGRLLKQSRFTVEGHASASPLADNDTVEHRAINRRVELTIIQGDIQEQENLVSAPDDGVVVLKTRPVEG